MLSPETKGAPRSSPLIRRSIVPIVSLSTHMRGACLRVVCVCTFFVCGQNRQNRELPMLLALPHHRPRQCPRPQHGQKTMGFKLVRRRRSGAIDRLQASQVGISYRRQGAWCELLMNACVCVCVCVCVSNAKYFKDRTEKLIKTRSSTITVAGSPSGCLRTVWHRCEVAAHAGQY